MLVLVLPVLVACGLKDDLYLPDPPRIEPDAPADQDAGEDNHAQNPRT